MNKLAKNRAVLGTFAVLMAIGIAAAYVPLLFPPSGSQNAPVEGNAAAVNDNISVQPQDSGAPEATPVVTSTVPAKASTLDSLNGLQDEQQSAVDGINNLLK